MSTARINKLRDAGFSEQQAIAVVALNETASATGDELDKFHSDLERKYADGFFNTTGFSSDLGLPN